MIQRLPRMLVPVTVVVFLWALCAPPMANGEDVWVEMSDGVKLATYVHMPVKEGVNFPVILIRTPYDLKMIDPSVKNFTDDGYVCVVQELRGRGRSEGKDMALSDEGWSPRSDGAETLAWVKRQPWCNGNIGTWGMSAIGITQVLLAGATTEVTCQSMSFAASSFYGQFSYQGGVFRKLLMEDWLKAMKAEHMLDVWRGHPSYDYYWRLFDGGTRTPQITAPGLHIGGWWDIFSQGTIDNFCSRQHGGGIGAKGNQKLIMGAWGHGPNPKPGDLVLPENYNFDYGTYERKYMAYWLKGEANGLNTEPAVRYYTLGDVRDPDAPGNEWRTADDWPPFPTTETPYYLHPDNTLSTKKGTGTDDKRTYAYNPATPCPTHGGAEITIPPGPFDQRELNAREDVLTFMTAPLEQPLEITGRIKVCLSVSSDAPDTDFTAKLLDVYPDGSEILMLDSIRRLKYRKGFESPEPLAPNTIDQIEIDLSCISLIFNKGHRIGVQISSSNYPRFEKNPNTGEDYPGPALRIANNTVYMSPDHPSALLIPVPVAGAQ